uniref:Bacterial type II secretion system protein E domain-containing protein n=1 Tax=Cupriavidus taiwanensis TaxID=164546 RepID=A0A375HBS5_9BURK|nr:protein of unknown function [Cupriavidus taiwanensis]
MLRLRARYAPHKIASAGCCSREFSGKLTKIARLSTPNCIRGPPTIAGMQSTDPSHPVLQLSQLEASAVAMFFESLSPIRAYVEASDVAEVMVNRHDSIWVERRGEMTRLDVRLEPAKLEGAVRSLASSVQKSAVRGTSQGIINAGHKGLRIAAVMQPTAIDGHALSIRRHRETNLSLTDYVKAGAFSSRHARSKHTDQPIFKGAVEDDALKDALIELVRQRKNILVAGGTSSGKTTFLNALVENIPDGERVLTIEDTMELKTRVPNAVRLLSNTDKNVTTSNWWRWRCDSARTAFSLARCAVARPSTCSRRSTPATTAAWPRSTPITPVPRCLAWRALRCSASHRARAGSLTTCAS